MERNQILIKIDEKVIASFYADVVKEDEGDIFAGADQANGYYISTKYPENTNLEWWLDEGHSINYSLQKGKWVRK